MLSGPGLVVKPSFVFQLNDFFYNFRPNYEMDKLTLPNEERLQKIILESRYIDDELDKPKERARTKHKIAPCVCEICQRYHELFHKSWYTLPFIRAYTTKLNTLLSNATLLKMWRLTAVIAQFTLVWPVARYVIRGL